MFGEQFFLHFSISPCITSTCDVQIRLLYVLLYKVIVRGHKRRLIILYCLFPIFAHLKSQIINLCFISFSLDAQRTYAILISTNIICTLLFQDNKYIMTYNLPFFIIYLEYPYMVTQIQVV